jgi:organic radical activating enzyme
MSQVLKKAADAAALSWNIACNTGRIPADHKCLVLIEPTSVCNLSCPLCPTGTGTLERKNKFIHMDVFDKIIKMTNPIAKGYVLNLFGEPTLHPRFPEIMEKTRHLPTWLSTHLNYGKDKAHELAKWAHLHIICSVDTLNPAEYGQYRVGGNYDKLLENLSIVAKGKGHVYPQFLISSDDTDKEQYMAFARKYGIPEENVILKIKLDNFRLDPTDDPTPGVCHFPYIGLYFNCDGYLVPCCNNVNGALHMAHVDKLNSIDDIYNDAKCVAMRQALAKNKNCFESCGRCDGMSFWKTEFIEYIKSAEVVVKRSMEKITGHK